MLSVRPLCSTGVTPLPCSYGPLRLPPGPLRRLCLPAARWSLSLPPCRASQAPRPIFPRALSPTTPEGPLAAFACCFTSGLVWLHPSRRTGHLRIPIEAESGSLALRLACSPPESLSVPSLEPTLVRLHAEQAIYMVNSFQFTRSARLILAYRPSGSVGQTAFLTNFLKKQIRRNTKELSQLADVRFAGLALAGQYLGRNAAGTEDRQQVCLA